MAAPYPLFFLCCKTIAPCFFESAAVLSVEPSSQTITSSTNFLQS